MKTIAIVGTPEDVFALKGYVWRLEHEGFRVIEVSDFSRLQQELEPADLAIIFGPGDSFYVDKIESLNTDIPLIYLWTVLPPKTSRTRAVEALSEDSLPSSLLVHINQLLSL